MENENIHLVSRIDQKKLGVSAVLQGWYSIRQTSPRKSGRQYPDDHHTRPVVHLHFLAPDSHFVEDVVLET